MRRIKRAAKGKKGIFYIPKVRAYSAVELVNNPHDIVVINRLGIRRTVSYIEHGSLEYVIGELKRESTTYVYKLNGYTSHSHTLDDVYRDALNNYSTFEFVEPVGRYFSEIQKTTIENIIEYQKTCAL